MKMKMLTCYGLAALLAGCVPVVSLHPLYSPDLLTFTEDLLGTWTEDANQPQVSWEFARLEAGAAERLPIELRDKVDKCYRVNLVDDKGRRGSLVGCLVKLHDHLFLDLLPDRFPAGEQDLEQTKFAYNAFFFLRVHTFVRVDSLPDRLKIRLTDDEKFGNLLAAHPKAVQCETIDDRPVLTASPAQLQAFVSKYADDELLFPNEMTLVRKSR